MACWPWKPSAKTTRATSVRLHMCPLRLPGKAFGAASAKPCMYPWQLPYPVGCEGHTCIFCSRPEKLAEKGTCAGFHWATHALFAAGQAICKGCICRPCAEHMHSAQNDVTMPLGVVTSFVPTPSQRCHKETEKPELHQEPITIPNSFHLPYSPWAFTSKVTGTDPRRPNGAVCSNAPLLKKPLGLPIPQKMQHMLGWHGYIGKRVLVRIRLSGVNYVNCYNQVSDQYHFSPKWKVDSYNIMHFYINVLTHHLPSTCTLEKEADMFHHNAISDFECYKDVLLLSKNMAVH